jgi:prophage regulatory protein
VTSLPYTLHPEQRLAMPEVEALSGRKKSKIYNLIAAGEFPAPEKDGPRCSRWRAGDVLEWLAKRRGAAA